MLIPSPIINITLLGFVTILLLVKLSFDTEQEFDNKIVIKEMINGKKRFFITVLFIRKVI